MNHEKQATSRTLGGTNASNSSIPTPHSLVQFTGDGLDSASVTSPPPEFFDQDDSTNCCFLCGNPKYTLTYDVSHFEFPFQFQQCQCGLIKQTPMPNDKFFEWFFNSDIFFSSKNTGADEIWGYYDYFKDEPSRLATSRHRYKKLKTVFEKDRKLDVMKIGPSTGTFLYTAKQAGHNAIGCDVSNRFAQYARDHYGIHIDVGRFERQPYEKGQFDVIVLMNVIENVPNQPEFLQAIYDRLKPGGHFVVNYVNMTRNVVAALQKDKYFIYRPPICYVYTKDVFERILAKFGFTVKGAIRDIRYMHLEKIFTLLRWRWALKTARLTGCHRIPFPIYAYPSSIVIAQKPV